MAARRTGRDRLRACDADREQVIDTLKAAFVQGRVSKAEVCLPAGPALASAADGELASRTYGELAAITFDIPARLGEAPPPRTAPAQDRNRIDKRTAAWGMFMILLPVTLGITFVTHYVGFFAMFLIAFIGVMAQPD